MINQLPHRVLILAAALPVLNPVRAAPPPAIFTTAPRYAAAGVALGIFPWAGTVWPLAADLNGDGKLDMILSGNSNLVTVLLNEGAGVFTQATPVAVPGGWLPRVQLGDFNNDGKFDLLTGGSRTNSYCILLGRGDGTFRPPLAETAPLPGPALDWVTVVDYDRDAKLDLVVGVKEDNFFVFHGNWDGTFAPAEHRSDGFPQIDAPVVDFNGDGLPDGFWSGENTSLCTCDHGRVHVSIALEDGYTFREETYFVLGGDWRTVAGDFTGDGKLDLLAAAYDGSVSLLVGRGDGTFQAPPLEPTEYAARSITTGDFNGDGKLDLLITESDDRSIRVLFGRGDGTFAGSAMPGFPQDPSVLGGTIGQAVVADLNGDGLSDAAVPYSTFATGGRSDIGLRVFLGRKDGTFEVIDRALGKALDPPLLGTGDFNGDGRTDLVTAIPSSELVSTKLSAIISFLLNRGDSTFEMVPVPFDATDWPGTLTAVGDFNGDGRLDLEQAYMRFNPASKNWDASISLRYGLANGHFQVAMSDTGSDSVGSHFYQVDLNGDGQPDLVRRAELDEFRVWLSQSGGLYGPPQYFASPTGRASGGENFIIGDFNGDGVVDVIAGSALWLGNGDGTFTFQLDLEGGGAAGPSLLTAGDYDGDGRGDLLLTTGYARTQTILLNRTPPRLRVIPGASGLGLSWPAFAKDYILETAAELRTAGAWQIVEDRRVLSGNTVTVAVPNGGGACYFRLRAP